jgi:SM-20-related protein
MGQTMAAEAEGLVRGPTSVAPNTAISTIDDVLDPALQRKIYDALRNGNWKYGWKSNPKTDQFTFWHRHFAGNVNPDHVKQDGKGVQYECADELKRQSPLIHEAWLYLRDTVLQGHDLVRCYANAFPFGCDGTLHTDSVAQNSFTSVYYPHDEWHPNWGGETVFFNRGETDIIASIYPKPNRLLKFPGTVPHVARGLSRCCPKMRVTLMFKTELS